MEPLASRWALAAALLLAAVATGPAAAAPPGKLGLGSDVTLGWSTFRTGIPTERAIFNLEFPIDSGEPEYALPVAQFIDLLGVEFEFLPVGGTPVGSGTHAEALLRQNPTDTPFVIEVTVFDEYDEYEESIEHTFSFNLGLAASYRLAVMGVDVDPDPSATLSIAFENPNGALANPLFLEHTVTSNMVAYEAFDRAAMVLALMVEDGDGDGDAAAQAFHTSFLTGVSTPLPNDSLFLGEPGVAVLGWETGPLAPNLPGVLEEMTMNLDVIVTPGDRVAAFGALFLVPEPPSAALLALAVVLAHARRSRR